MVEFEDANGRPRPNEDLVAAVKCLETEMVKNPMAMAKNGEPLLIHYVVIRDVLIAELKRRGA